MSFPTYGLVIVFPTRPDQTLPGPLTVLRMDLFYAHPGLFYIGFRHDLEKTFQ